MIAHAMVVLMSVDEARTAESAIIKTGDQLRAQLLAFSERQGYMALGYASYSAWADAIAPRLFGVTRRRLAQELTAALIERELGTMVPDGVTIPERQLRPMSALDPEDRPVAWREANERTNGKPTARVVTHVVAEMRGMPELEDTPLPSTRFTSGMRSSETPEWYTPSTILDAVRMVFGGTIDTDPCTHADAQRTVRASRYYTQADDGLIQPWEGNAFVNPPYGSAIVPWIPRMIEAYTSGECQSVIALLPGRTDTDWFTPLFTYPICFVHGRLTFSNAPQAATFPSVVVYLGRDLAAFTHAFAPFGPIMVPHEAM